MSIARLIPSSLDLNTGGSCRRVSPPVIDTRSACTGEAPPPHRAGGRAAGTPASAGRAGMPFPAPSRRHPRVMLDSSERLNGPCCHTAPNAAMSQTEALARDPGVRIIPGRIALV